jgi:large subunit ribosomal protein L20
MVKIKRGSIARVRRKKVLKLAKGFMGAHSRLFRPASGQVMKALLYSYSGRKLRKKANKGVWVSRINAAARNENLTYGKIRRLLKEASVVLNLKMLAQLALLDKGTFSLLIKKFNIRT